KGLQVGLNTGTSAAVGACNGQRYGNRSPDTSGCAPAALLSHWIRRSQNAATELRAVPIVADRFDRAAFHCFFAKTFFVRRLRLLVHVGVAAIIVSFEIGGSRFAAQIAVDALIIDVEFARYVLGVFVRCVGHIFPEGEEKR